MRMLDIALNQGVFAYDEAYLSGPHELFGGVGARLWGYHTTDNLATIKGAGYIADASDRGMQVGDIVIAVTVTTLPNTTPTGVKVFNVDSIASGAATLDDTAIT